MVKRQSPSQSPSQSSDLPFDIVGACNSLRLTRREMLRFSAWTAAGVAGARASALLGESEHPLHLIQDIQRIDTRCGGLALSSLPGALLLGTAWIGRHGEIDADLLRSVVNPQLAHASMNRHVSTKGSKHKSNWQQEANGNSGSAKALCSIDVSPALQSFPLEPSLHVMRLLRSQMPFLRKRDIRSTLVAEQEFLPSANPTYRKTGRQFQVEKTVRMRLRFHVAHHVEVASLGYLEGPLTNTQAARLVNTRLPENVSHNDPFTFLLRGQLNYLLHPSIVEEQNDRHHRSFVASTGALQPTLRLWSSVPDFSAQLLGCRQQRAIGWAQEEFGSMRFI